MDTKKALITTTQRTRLAKVYADTLDSISDLANKLTRQDTFQAYHESLSENSKFAQLDTLSLFSEFIGNAGIAREVEDLYLDAQAWKGIKHGLLTLFRDWLLKKGYRTTTVNHRLTIIRQYCRLAHQVGVIDDAEFDLILTVKGFNGKSAKHIDENREKQGVPTTTGKKKATPAPVFTGQAQRLKKETTHPEKPYTRRHDKTLEARDNLLMGLLIENALRVSEVVGLDLECFDLEKGYVTVYRSKTHKTQTHKLFTHTRIAAETYIQGLERTTGPLFTAYQDKRITRKGIYSRVHLLGEQVGIKNLSPHDLRHYWTRDALQKGNPLDKIQKSGNWTTGYMVLRYAEMEGIANEGVEITE